MDNKTALYYAKKLCDTLMMKYEADELGTEGHYFNYHCGVFLSGMERVYKLTDDEKYHNYIKAWVASVTDENGNIIEYNPKNLDDIQPSNVMFDLYKKTGDCRYKKILDTLVPALKTWRTNEEGGFWHKEIRPRQMWLDGLYMAGPVALRYGAEFGCGEYEAIMHKQAMLMYKHLYDEEKGLMYHAWDCSKVQEWADKETGRAPEVWGRAMGWYTVAIVDMLDYIKDEKIRKDFIAIINTLAKNLIKYQSSENGIWYQVIDKGCQEGNWVETSCSCLFTYSIAKALRKGYIDDEYKNNVQCAYNGVLNYIKEDENGLISIENVCIGTGVGDYDFYINRPRVSNDLHGAGAFVLMCTEVYKFLTC